MRTFHHDLHVFRQAVQYIEGLRNCCPRLLVGESIESLKNRFDFFFTQEFLSVFLC